MKVLPVFPARAADPAQELKGEIGGNPPAHFALEEANGILGDIEAGFRDTRI